MIEQSGVRVVTGEVIYEILDEVKKKIEEMIPPEIKRIDLGRAKILKFFKKDGSRQILGGRVEEGIIKKGAKIQINRLKENVGSGSILELQREKQPVTEVIKGFEFGAMIDSRTEIQEGDVIEIFEEEVIKRTL
jgi:translation initiation factor IF-2